MAESLPIPKSYKRLGPFAIDEDSVFTTQSALDAYLAGGSSYAGQVIALVLDSDNEAQIFKVNKDKSLGSIGSVDITIDTRPTENSDNPVSSGGVFTELGKKAEKSHAHLRYNVFTASFSFSGIDSFPIAIGQKVRIDSIIKATNINELRVSLNGNATSDITSLLPLTIEASDTIVFEATYDRATDSNFTLIGEKL